MTIKELRATLSALETAYTTTRDGSNNPHETARTFIRSVGTDTAAQCVAAMIRRASWDGRISRTAKDWANSVALSAEWARHIEDTYCDAIHPAHLSQIAESMPTELEFCAAEAETEATPHVTVQAIRERVEIPYRSAWNRGVSVYANELLDSLEEAIEGGYFWPDDLAAPKVLEKALLNGAADWNQYSWGGCSLCYDCQIAARLCTPSELRKTRGGDRRPNSREEWLDVQARALSQAARRILTAAKDLSREEAHA